jgi:hypothetical protein
MVVIDPWTFASSRSLGDLIAKDSLFSHGNGYREYLQNKLWDDTSDITVDIIGTPRDEAWQKTSMRAIAASISRKSSPTGEILVRQSAPWC